MDFYKLKKPSVFHAVVEENETRIKKKKIWVTRYSIQKATQKKIDSVKYVGGGGGLGVA